MELVTQICNTYLCYKFSYNFKHYKYIFIVTYQPIILVNVGNFIVTYAKCYNILLLLLLLVLLLLLLLFIFVLDKNLS